MIFKKDKHINKRYNKLIVRDLYQKDTGQKYKKTFASCVCDCGRSKDIRLDSILSDKTTSCGCERGISFQRHGDSGTLLHRKWKGMRNRCKRSSSYSYVNVCEEWDKSFPAFKTWALSNHWSETEKRVIPHRIENSEQYGPDSVRFVTEEEHRQIHKRKVFG